MCQRCMVNLNDQYDVTLLQKQKFNIRSTPVPGRQRDREECHGTRHATDLTVLVIYEHLTLFFSSSKYDSGHRVYL